MGHKLKPRDGEVARLLFERHPPLRPEAVAKHYVLTNGLAEAILGDIKYARTHTLSLGERATITTRIATNFRRLQDGHLHDLGIPLKWKKPKSPQ